MVVSSGFFNSVAGDRKYDARWYADYFASFIGNGVFPNPSNGLQVVEGTSMRTVVKPGKGWINGYFVVNTEDFIIQHDVAHASLPRIDSIVLQKNTAERAINIVVKKGRESSSPVSYFPVRDSDYYELVLADVRIEAGSTRISQSNITDQRLNNNLCGIVHGVVDQVDTSTIFNQYQSWFNLYSQTKAQEFESWKNQTQQVVDNWINNEQLDFESWRNDQESLYTTWSSEQQQQFVAWFNDIRDILASTDIGNHLLDELPHQYTDSNGKIYKYGLGAENGIPYLLIEGVIS
ncbi:hypothetical protein [Solibacillus isronensis]|uniref:hypothetical protein n=1 Tax=Solibacillus isronensis TaxID=412383 RepID=UPI0039A1B2AD